MRGSTPPSPRRFARAFDDLARKVDTHDVTRGDEFGQVHVMVPGPQPTSSTLSPLFRCGRRKPAEFCAVRHVWLRRTDS